MKITLIGKPGRIEKKRDLIITTLSHPDLPDLPDVPEAEQIKYTVFISERQWHRTVKPLFKSKSVLVIEGYCSYNPEIGAMAVYAMSVQTQPIPDRKQKTNGRNDPQVTEQQADNPTNQEHAAQNDAATVVQKRLQELEGVAAIYRQKIADIQSKPPDQQFGLDMTLKLLKNIESEIQALLAEDQKSS